MTMISRDLTRAASSHAAREVHPELSSTSPQPRASSQAVVAYWAWGKRFFDIAVVSLTAPLWLPVIAVAALVIFAGDRKWPFYTQDRLGRDGKVFRLWKLRTMVVDADQRLETYLAGNPQARAEWDATQKLKADPRIIPAGSILRKSSLDELPQLFNVLSGDMSLVGPRPFMLNQKGLYSGSRYYRMRPGLTGLWQISDRNDCKFADRVRYDNAYYAAVSLKTDVTVMVRTFGVVVRGTGY